MAKLQRYSKDNVIRKQKALSNDQLRRAKAFAHTLIQIVNNEQFYTPEQMKRDAESNNIFAVIAGYAKDFIHGITIEGSGELLAELLADIEPVDIYRALSDLSDPLTSSFSEEPKVVAPEEMEREKAKLKAEEDKLKGNLDWISKWVADKTVNKVLHFGVAEHQARIDYFSAQIKAKCATFSPELEQTLATIKEDAENITQESVGPKIQKLAAQNHATLKDLETLFYQIAGDKEIDEHSRRQLTAIITRLANNINAMQTKISALSKLNLGLPPEQIFGPSQPLISSLPRIMNAEFSIALGPPQIKPATELLDDIANDIKRFKETNFPDIFVNSISFPFMHEIIDSCLTWVLKLSEKDTERGLILSQQVSLKTLLVQKFMALMIKTFDPEAFYAQDKKYQDSLYNQNH